MARQLPAHLSHKSALVLLPPPSITAPIEAVRRLHDKHFARWPPHINLLYPFLTSPSNTGDHEGETSGQSLRADIRTRLQLAVKSVEPFTVSLSADPPGTFHHSKKSRTVWLGPSTQSVQHLQSVLQAEFSECDADQRHFTPHLSVGQAHNDRMEHQLAAAIKQNIADYLVEKDASNSGALTWHISEVFVIEREGFHDRFQIIGRAKLGTEAEVGTQNVQ